MEKYEIREDDDLICQLHEIYHKECNELETTHTITDKLIDLKGKDNETLISVFKDVLENPNCVNYSVILNSNLLLNGYNTLDDSMFENNEVWFSNIEQLIDIKLEMSAEIQKFQTQLAFWWIAVMKSAYKIEYVYLDQLEEVPNLYKRLLITSPLIALSQCVAKSKGINLENVPMVKDGYPILMEVCSTAALSYKMLGMLDLA